MENQEKNPNNESPQKLKIIVNGQEKIWTKIQISFEDVVILAFGSINPDPNIVYTVTFKEVDGDRKGGVMVKGDSIKAKNGTIFNATSTDKS